MQQFAKSTDRESAVPIPRCAPSTTILDADAVAMPSSMDWYSTELDTSTYAALARPSAKNVFPILGEIIICACPMVEARRRL